jgi:hypothetical protein
MSKTHQDSLPKDHLIGNGGELHQVAGELHPPMTNQTGTLIADDENSLKAGERGPDLLEDFFQLEKTQHFDHERIPERVVHARGFGAKGYFELLDPLTGITKAKVLTEVGVRTPVFTRFSTVAGNMGSTDVARDVRGFAVKFYTQRATGISSATTSLSFSSRTPSSSPTSSTPSNRSLIAASPRRSPPTTPSGTGHRSRPKAPTCSCGSCPTAPSRALSA